MEYEFTYCNMPIKMRYNKLVAINTMDIKCLINHFLLWLPIELDIWLDIVNVHYVEPRSIYEFIALFNDYYIGPFATILTYFILICILE